MSTLLRTPIIRRVLEMRDVSLVRQVRRVRQVATCRYAMRMITMSYIMVWSTASFAQEGPLPSYISAGIKNNLLVKEKNISLDKALLALKSAKGLFLPNVSLQGAYQNGDGGRSISIPVGDLVNPVYTTLNQLTGTQAFPQIENVKQNFFPDNLYDMKLRTSLALLNSDLFYNRKLQSQQVVLQQLELEVYQRELVKEIKIAYYNYLSATRAVSIYENAVSTAREGKRINERLLENGKGLPAFSLRSEAEVQAMVSKYEEAVLNRNNAQLYFNFLLNTDPTSPIDTTYNPAPEISQVNLLLQRTPVVEKREELASLQQVNEMGETMLRMKRAYLYPKVSGFLDLGLQAERAKLSSDDADYYLAGIQLEIPLFAGFTNRHKIQQAKWDMELSSLQLTDAQKKLAMGANISLNRLNGAWSQYLAAQRQVEAAAAYHRLINKGYIEGVHTFLEKLDASNQYTNAQLQLNLSELNILSALAQLERDEATYPIQNFKNSNP
ncbi:MAG: TolC family protein [Bacteroidetes bacterium]|nr:TolC family protein [Bacteroidota bacterium]